MTAGIEGLPSDLRPVAPAVKWWVAALTVLTVAAREAVFHTWLAHLPVMEGRRIDTIVSVLLVAVAALAFLRLIQAYEGRLARFAVNLRETNKRLRALEAERDARLLDLSRDLSLVLTHVLWRSEEARQFPEAFDREEALAEGERLVGSLQAVIRAMIELRHHGDGLTERVPEILEEYSRFVEAQARSLTEQLRTQIDWGAVRRQFAAHEAAGHPALTTLHQRGIQL